VKKELHFKSAVLGLVALGALVSSASAVVLPTTSVVVNGTTYDVTYFEGTYNDNSSLFTIAEMPWWGDFILAQQILNAVGDKLGLPNSNGAAGPAFAWKLAGDPPSVVDYFVYRPGTFPASQSAQMGDNFSYAKVAPQSAAPVPAPLPLFGAAAAFSATRRLRSMSRTLHRSTTAGS
jgi:hypothetical protein